MAVVVDGAEQLPDAVPDRQIEAALATAGVRHNAAKTAAPNAPRDLVSLFMSLVDSVCDERARLMQERTQG